MNETTSSKKPIILILIVIVLLVGLGLTGYLLLNKKQTTSTVTETTEQEREEVENNTLAFKQDSNFAVDKPFEKGKYKIEYEGINATYYVTFETADLTAYRKVKKEAEQEFKNWGVSDLCEIKLIFIVPKAIKDAKVADSLASGCKPL